MTSQERRAYRKLAEELSRLSAKAWAIADHHHVCDANKLTIELKQGVRELCATYYGVEGSCADLPKDKEG